MRQRRLTTGFSCWVSLLVVLTTAGRARAAPDFEDLFQQGNELAQAGRSGPALAAYKQAYQVRPEPIVLVAMGMINLQLGRYQDALKACQKYLVVEKAPAARAKQANECIAQAKERLRPLTTPKNSTSTPAVVSSLPNLPAAAAPALTKIEITATPAVISSVSLQVRPWSPSQLEPEIAPQTTTEARVMPSAPVRPTPVYKKWWFWTTLGLVAAGAAIGLGVGLTQSTGSSPLPAVDPIADIPLANRRMVTF